MGALALLTGMRAGTLAVEMLKSLRSPTQASPLAPFKAKRGLASPGVSPSCGGGSGAECWPSLQRSTTFWPDRSGVGSTKPSLSLIP